MKNNGTSLKFILISIMTVIMSLSTLIFGAPMLRVLRKTFGPKLYWFEGFFIVTAFVMLKMTLFGVMIGSLWLTVGSYVELEQRGCGWWKSALLAILTGGIFVATFAAVSYKYTQGTIVTDLQVTTEKLISQIKEANPNFQIEASTLFSQLPSVIVVLLGLGLGIGLIFEKIAFSIAGLPRERIASQLHLLDFKVPDFFIWVALTSLLVSVLGAKVHWLGSLALNIVNVSALLYFFQGLAVVETFLRFARAGVLVRVIVYLILIGQMFTLVSLIGLIDFWVEFRQRLKRYIAR